jgi:hypothetical protein
MIFKLSILAALVVPFVSALTVNAPSQPVNNGGEMTITWTASPPNDPPVVSAYLTNPSFNNKFAISNNINTNLGNITIPIPAVPDNQQYTIVFTPINDDTKILAQSSPFTIGAAVTTASTASSTSAASASSNTRTATAPVSTRTPGASVSSTGGFGSTISNSNSATSAAASTAAAATTSASSALPVRFDMSLGVMASVVLSVFAGAAVVAL